MVAFRNPGLRAFKSEMQMSAHVGRIAALSASGKVYTSSAKTDNLIGIITDGGFSAGSNVQVCLSPGMTVQGESVAAINEGAKITVSGGGKCASAAVASTTVNIGYAITAATASGQLVDIMITGPALYTQ